MLAQGVENSANLAQATAATTTEEANRFSASARRFAQHQAKILKSVEVLSLDINRLSLAEAITKESVADLQQTSANDNARLLKRVTRIATAHAVFVLIILLISIYRQ